MSSSGSERPAVGDRYHTQTGLLARLSFNDTAAAADLLARAPSPLDREILEALGRVADPDVGLAALVRLIDAETARRGSGRAGAGGADGDLLSALHADPPARDRLLAVLGASVALGEHLARHPEHWRALSGPDATARPDAGTLRERLLHAVGADPAADAPVAADAGPATLMALRVAYRRHLLYLAARDLTGVATLDEVTAELADLAAAAIDAALAIGRAEVGTEHECCRLAVIGMGKCGGRELNYVSDVDVIFVAEPAAGAGEQKALRVATKLASATMRACSASTPEGALWQVDAGLRPEGKAGPLVRTIASHRAYYDRWAKSWEFQALLKARPIAGDRELGADYHSAVAPLVWTAASREGFVGEVQEMRRRVEAHVRPDQAERQLKLGPGGLRDIEFAVQLLQLVHGRSDPELRSGTTVAALDALSRGGYVGREDAATLSAAYRFLRRVEHLLQLYRLRRTHLIPDDPRALRRLGRALGCQGDPAEAFIAEWRGHARQARRLHEKLFYRPLLRAVARLPGPEARLSPQAARERLEALGYADPAGALRHIEALTSGVSRRAAIQRTLLPVMLEWFAHGPDPDAGLLGFRQVSDALGSTPWYLRMLRDEYAVAERMAKILASSRYATGLLLRAPEAVALLADDPPVPEPAPAAPGAPPPGAPSGPVPAHRLPALAPRPVETLRAEAHAAVRRYDDADRAITAVRALRRRELFRVAVADLLGLVDVERLGEALTAIAAATVDAGLDVAIRQVERARGRPLPTRFSIVAMGRFGGYELGYGSDADLLFVHEPHADVDERVATDAAHAVAEELRRSLARPAPDPPLVIDPGLRPEGRQGPLVRTLASYAAYYARWSSPWERQALLRAEPVAGDATLGARFRDLIDPIRWPRHGIAASEVREIRRLKARMEAERLPRGADPSLHTKLGPGGLSDVEWLVQLLQLRHAHAVPGLRTTRTLRALEAAAQAGLIEEGDARALAAAWRLASRIRGTIVLVRGRPADSLPTDVVELSAVARVLGHPTGGDLLEEYRRVSRRARAVVERVFYE